MIKLERKIKVTTKTFRSVKELFQRNDLPDFTDPTEFDENYYITQSTSSNYYITQDKDNSYYIGTNCG